jgi:hypothetical protein
VYDLTNFIPQSPGAIKFYDNGAAAIEIKRDWTKPMSRDKTDPNDATAIESKRRTNLILGRDPMLSAKHERA